MIHTDEDDEFERIAHEAKMKGQPYYFKPPKEDDDDIQDYSRPWVGLTKQEMYGAFNRALANRRPDRLHWDMAMYIDEILRKKNT